VIDRYVILSEPFGYAQGKLRGSPEYDLEHAQRSEIVVTHTGPVGQWRFPTPARTLENHRLTA
jgi:hypothetical protein